MFQPIAAMVNRRGWLVVAGWLAFAGILYAFAPAWEQITRDDDVSFFPPEYPSVIGQALLERGFPEDVASTSVVVVAERPDGPLTDDDKQFVSRLSGDLENLGSEERGRGLGIRRVTDYTHAAFGSKLIGTRADGPGQAALTVVSLEGTYASKKARGAVERIAAELGRLRGETPAGLKLSMTGSPVVGRDNHEASKRSIDATTWATIGLVVVILLVVYRSPLLAMVPLLTIALSVWTSLMAIALLTKIPGLNFQVINITNVFVIVVLFGAGTDYCLFLIARYREELAKGRVGLEALAEAIHQVGGALVASAGTVIVGLGMLWFSTFAKISYTGPAIALSLVIALVASLTLAPVFLRWMRGTVFWPFRPPHHTQGADRERESLDEIPMSGFWGRVADLIVDRPLLILTLSLLAMAPLAYVGMQTRSSYDLLGDLPDDQPSVVGARTIQRYFPDGELGPSFILVDNPKLDFATDAGIDAIERVCRKLAAVPDVAEVRAISRPLGRTLVTVARRIDGRAGSNPIGGLLGQGQDRVVLRGSRDRYVSTRAEGADRNHIARIDLVFKTSPFAGRSLDALTAARQVVERAAEPDGPLAGTRQVGLAGTTTLVNDLKAVTIQDEQRMYLLVTVGVYAILVVLLRRPGVSLYLIATVVLGYLASLGLTDLVFRALHHGPEPWAGLDWKVGFFLFVILVAVGEDYNIFLMTRVIEEERKFGTVEGTRRAVAHTGGIISSCGLIMAGTFAAMLTGSLRALQELGFALCMGVLLDTFIVRPILVPAFVVLLHRIWPSLHIEPPLTIPVDLPERPASANGHAANGHADGPKAKPGVWTSPRFKDGWH